MKMKAESARLFFTLSINQFINEVIPLQVLIDRLRTLESLISKSTALFDIIKRITDEVELDIAPTDNSTKHYLEKILNIASSSGGLLELVWTCKITDNDPFPSLPHIHDNEKNIKYDIYTGHSSDGAHDLKKQVLIELWNDNAFIKKLEKNRYTIEHASASRHSNSTNSR